MSVGVGTVASIIGVELSEFPIVPSEEPTGDSFDYDYYSFWSLAFEMLNEAITDFEHQSLLAGYLTSEVEDASGYCTKVNTIRKAVHQDEGQRCGQCGT